MRREDGASPVAVAVVLIVVAALSVGTVALMLPAGDDDDTPPGLAELTRVEVAEIRADCREYLETDDAAALQRLNTEASLRGVSLFELCDAVERRTDVPDEP